MNAVYRALAFGRSSLRHGGSRGDDGPVPLGTAPIVPRARISSRPPGRARRCYA